MINTQFIIVNAYLNFHLRALFQKFHALTLKKQLRPQRHTLVVHCGSIVCTNELSKVNIGVRIKQFDSRSWYLNVLIRQKIYGRI